jgi:hypothetical protein
MMINSNSEQDSRYFGEVKLEVIFKTNQAVCIAHKLLVVLPSQRAFRGIDF